MRLLVTLLMACIFAMPTFAETVNVEEEANVAVFQFSNEESVMEYLEEGTYVGNGLTVHIKRNGVYANGRLLTGEVSVERYNSEIALISMTPPGYDRVYFRIDAASHTLIDNQGFLYVREK